MAPGRRLVGTEMTKVGPKEAQRAALREKAAAPQKRAIQRTKPVSGPKLQPKVPEATPDEIVRLLKQRDKRRATARVYQREYYATHREKILTQRKAREKKASAK